VALVLDTGPLLAAIDRRDPDHSRCSRLLEQTAETLVIPAPVLGEIDYWIYKELHVGALITLLDQIAEGTFVVENLLPADYRRVREVCNKYWDSDVGLVDAAVLAIVERLDEPKLATLDHRHFGMIRPRHVKALQLLPE